MTNQTGVCRSVFRNWIVTKVWNLNDILCLTYQIYTQCSIRFYRMIYGYFRWPNWSVTVKLRKFLKMFVPFEFLNCSLVVKRKFLIVSLIVGNNSELFWFYLPNFIPYCNEMYCSHTIISSVIFVSYFFPICRKKTLWFSFLILII